MIAIKLAMALAAIGTLVCLWLLVRVTWYNFLAFMLFAQPFLLAAAVLYAAVVLRDLRRKGVL